MLPWVPGFRNRIGSLGESRGLYVQVRIVGNSGYSATEKAEEVVMLPDVTNAPQFSWLPFRHGLRVSFYFCIIFCSFLLLGALSTVTHRAPPPPTAVLPVHSWPHGNLNRISKSTLLVRAPYYSRNCRRTHPSVLEYSSPDASSLSRYGTNLKRDQGRTGETLFPHPTWRNSTPF